MSVRSFIVTSFIGEASMQLKIKKRTSGILTCLERLVLFESTSYLQNERKKAFQPSIKTFRLHNDYDSYAKNKATSSKTLHSITWTMKSETICIS